MGQFHFVKSTYSLPDPNKECVEVAIDVAASVAVRDSKVPAGPVVRVGAGAWAAFLREPPTRQTLG
ncbi:DUF397 domain-containing protein [Streptomyces sp. NPDC049879]|uniref:DUF397 domain-containing protein n=1 Tax=Streptomyces sp. NPDC049879 TaxID=3365598 RepID=UPI00378D37BA